MDGFNFKDPLGDSWLPYQIAFGVGLLVFIRTYMKGMHCPSANRIDGKVVIVTGASAGIGIETAQELAKRGGKVIMACRDVQKGEKVMQEIKEKVKNAKISVMQMDLASFASIRQFVKEFEQNETQLDILINNAAVMLCPFSKTEDGFEQHFQVNYLGHFLLTNLLMDKLKAAPSARIINVSALAHKAVTLQLDDMNQEKNYVGRVAYGHSKLAQILSTKELSKRLEGTKVTVNALHPGIVRDTEIARHTMLTMPILKWGLYPLSWLLTKTPKDGAQTTIYLAVASEVEDVTGKYFSDCQLANVSADAEDEESAKKLWDLSEEFTKLP